MGGREVFGGGPGGGRRRGIAIAIAVIGLGNDVAWCGAARWVRAVN